MENNLRDMNKLFTSCNSLKYIPDISKWNTFNVVNMESIFSFCYSLESLPDLSKWNTKNVKNIPFIMLTFQRNR